MYWNWPQHSLYHSLPGFGMLDIPIEYHHIHALASCNASNDVHAIQTTWIGIVSGVFPHLLLEVLFGSKHPTQCCWLCSTWDDFMCALITEPKSDLLSLMQQQQNQILIQLNVCFFLLGMVFQFYQQMNLRSWLFFSELLHIFCYFHFNRIFYAVPFSPRHNGIAFWPG